MGKTAHKKKKEAKVRPGLVGHWIDHVKVKEPELFSQMGAHWRDHDYDNAQQAIDSFPLPEGKELRKASRKTIERIFGNRTKTKRIK